VLTTILVSGSPVPFFLAKKASTNSDGAWIEAILMLFAAMGIVIFVLFIGTSIFLGLAKGRGKNRFYSLGFSIVVFLAAFFLGWNQGQDQWEKEFQKNRTHVNGIIAELEDLKTKNGVYPEDLKKVAPDVGPIIEKSGKPIPIEYERKGPQEYELSYRYGWYDYLYRSEQSKWIKYD
jgi:hypothetical protein